MQSSPATSSPDLAPAPGGQSPSQTSTSADQAGSVLIDGQDQATITLVSDRTARTYHLATTAKLRDGRPPEGEITFAELPGRPTVRTGHLLFDGLYALAINEAQANSVSSISDEAYGRGAPVEIEAFETGELWKYVWTRDLSYALDLGLAGFDPARGVQSLRFKSSSPKVAVSAGVGLQIVQDTGSGGSYPVSTDRVVWTLGAQATLRHLPASERERFLAEVYPILRGTIEQDRRLVFDPADGLYRGEQSFLDWREQTYPNWTRNNVLTIAMSKALSVNAGNYAVLTHAAEHARRLGHADDAARYAGWADDLRAAVNRRFWDPAAGLYVTYLLSDDGVSDSVPVARYDLLGGALAVLSGLADGPQAASVVAHTPFGLYGPPVVWPQERTVPVYHNQGMWPFVTAYGLRAARHVDHVPAVDASVRSLVSRAALNLSNMENLDFVSGRTRVTDGPRQGPVVNSRRQLWSVAGYLSMVQDLVFGLETSWEGIRFRPYVTASVREEFFRGTDTLEWNDFTFRGKRVHVRIQLPPAGSFAHGRCEVQRVELNGQLVGDRFVAEDDLRAINEWQIFLQAPAVAAPPPPPLARVDGSDERALCAPVQPAWDEARGGGITLSDERLTLHFAHPEAADVTFDIYRDGQRCASGVRQTHWTDPDSGDHRDVVRSYRVAAVDPHSGHVSHLTAALAHRSADQRRAVSARSLQGEGISLVDSHHLERWGEPGQTLVSGALSVERAGRYLVRAEFANGAGSIFTGLACAVKRLDVRHAATGEAAATGYLVMPQSGDWTRYDLSSAVPADLRGGEDYTLHLWEDEYCRNMSYLQSNVRYTAFAGGGEAPYNRVNLATLHVLFLKAR